MRSSLNSKSGIQRLTKGRTSYPAGSFTKLGLSEQNKYTKSEDGIERRKIHSDIKRMIKENQDKEKIISYLLETYPSSSVKDFFEKYVDYHLEKDER